MDRLIENFVKHVAHIHKLTLPAAVKFINKCLIDIGANENIDQSEITHILYSFYGLSKCLAGSCSNAEMNECQKMCHCVWYKGECKPRYIPEAPDINADPDKWIKNLKTPDLEKLVEYASFLYYNYDGGGLTDNAFDALEYQLNKRLKLKGRRWEKLGSEPIEKLRVQLPYPMPSLEKIKPGEKALLNFLKTKTAITWSEKLDGVSGLVVYASGKIIGIYTRGDGIIGGNVKYLENYINFPTVEMETTFAVRGEFIISKRKWQEKYAGDYANPRSFVSGKINSGYVTPALQDLEFLAYSIIDGKGYDKLGSQQFKILTSLGFKTPVNGVFEPGVLIAHIIYTYRTQRPQSEYSIDGLVLETAEGDKRAFKMLLEEQIRSTKITDIEWNITRYGRYFPKVIYESVFVDGVRLHKASGGSAKKILDLNMGRGTKIKVARSGDVIPVVKDVEINTEIIPILPPSGKADPEWYWEGSDILLRDIEGNDQVHIKRISYFFEIIGTAQLGEGRVRKLYDAGFKTLEKITSAAEADLRKVKGLGPKLSQQLYKNIHSSMRTTRLDRYFEAITTFKASVGRKTLKLVIRHYPGILTASAEEIAAHFKKNTIKGIGKVKIQGLIDMIPKFKKLLFKLNEADIKYALEHQKNRLEKLEKDGYNSKIKNGIFVFTGFLMNPDLDLEDEIWDNWGDIVTTVTRNTTAVISANIANITEKTIKAQELGVPVYSVEEFAERFGLTVKIKPVSTDEE